ncbi:unnamed protein product [Cuscuta epithymum]|uniref:HTH myb-type domain-containing protein n=1 Tax=Cuscuta epithymum TaxID=186058 RepID=A0AAV0ERG0_9ASTE|nr:unnamed protein product [Cuscuta epithymum]
MDSFSPELQLDCRTPSVLPTITEFLSQISMIGNLSERLMKINDRVWRLEEEMRKIDAFKRELPLCMFLLNDVIVFFKEESMKCRKSLIGPVYEEFLPVKKSSENDDDDDDDGVDGDNRVEAIKENDSKEKIKWTSSFKLWNGDKDYLFSEFSNNSYALKSDLRILGHSGIPTDAVRKDRHEELTGVVPPGLSLSTPGIKDRLEDIVIDGLNSKASKVVDPSSAATSNSLQQAFRKQRRCWSAELHKRFVSVLHQLGGPQVATPKQIRELMQVEGLTNDEVKSHLQKYRLHIRRIPRRQFSSENKSIVMLGDLDHDNNKMFMRIDQIGEFSKQSCSQSGSPQGTLLLGESSRGTSMSGGDSMEDDKSE